MRTINSLDTSTMETAGDTVVYPEQHLLVIVPSLVGGFTIVILGLLYLLWRTKYAKEVVILSRTSESNRSKCELLYFPEDTNTNRALISHSYFRLLNRR